VYIRLPLFAFFVPTYALVNATCVALFRLVSIIFVICTPSQIKKHIVLFIAVYMIHHWFIILDYRRKQMLLSDELNGFSLFLHY